MYLLFKVREPQGYSPAHLQRGNQAEQARKPGPEADPGAGAVRHPPLLRQPLAADGGAALHYV